ncbi:hypothetical protein BC936DRAFT_144508 [Jimgerdemannia flammicorona]|uniref:Uncharacterized protein n=1 Tax=Jimgerdemannia flammicorona TaxID=994334 RepID=A0A433DCA9_9FUNG|nr:hypothetical protein BC936DRAFT_144508 [Jimgerdemannia flammicorona]
MGTRNAPFKGILNKPSAEQESHQGEASAKAGVQGEAYEDNKSRHHRKAIVEEEATTNYSGYEACAAEAGGHGEVCARRGDERSVGAFTFFSTTPLCLIAYNLPIDAFAISEVKSTKSITVELSPEVLALSAAGPGTTLGAPR